MELLLDELLAKRDKLFKEREENPRYWPNNKRKLHHISLKRKYEKVDPKYLWYKEHKVEIFNTICEILELTLPKEVEKQYEEYSSFQDIETDLKNESFTSKTRIEMMKNKYILEKNHES